MVLTAQKGEFPIRLRAAACPSQEPSHDLMHIVVRSVSLRDVFTTS